MSEPMTVTRRGRHTTMVFSTAKLRQKTHSAKFLRRLLLQNHQKQHENIKNTLAVTDEGVASANNVKGVNQTICNWLNSLPKAWSAV